MQPQLKMAVVPIAAALAGFVAGRWSTWPSANHSDLAMNCNGLAQLSMPTHAETKVCQAVGQLTHVMNTGAYLGSGRAAYQFTFTYDRTKPPLACIWYRQEGDARRFGFNRTNFETGVWDGARQVTLSKPLKDSEPWKILEVKAVKR